MLAKSCLVALFLAAASIPAQAADGVEGLLRLRGEAFVSAMQAQGDALVAFARDHLESRVTAEGLAPRFAERMRADYAELGAIDRHSIQVLQSGRLLFVYCRRTRTGTWQSYQFRVNAADGHRLQLVFRATAVEPLERPSVGVSTDEGRAWVRRFEAHLQATQPFSGIALVQRSGSDVHALVQGPANALTGEPVERTTRFGMASGSKMFTAVAVLQLVQAGRVALGARLIDYLPSFPDADFARRATIHQLLTHTAGAGNYWDDAYERAWGSITELRDMLPFVLPHLAATAEGAFVYSNSGYVLLGLVIEAVSGMRYDDYLRKHIFDPAGMTHTGFPLRAEQGRGFAQPYEPEVDAGAVKPGVYVPVTLGAKGSSAGGASTTADDLVRFVEAVQRGVLLDAAHRDLMTRRHVAYAGPDSWYGYGTIVETSRGVTSWGHGGMARGTYFELKVYPDLDALLLVMSNYNTIAGPETASALDHLVRNGSR